MVHHPSRRNLSLNAKQSTRATLLDGSIEIAVAQPADTEAVLAFTRALSPDSGHGRYFAGLGNAAIEHEVRREMCDTRNLSLLARSKADGRIMGHALAAPVSGNRAELAFAVADGMQHHGIGTALLGALLCALRARGIHRFEATTLPENSAMREVFVASGFSMLADARGVQAHLDDAEFALPD